MLALSLIWNFIFFFDKGLVQHKLLLVAVVEVVEVEEELELVAVVMVVGLELVSVVQVLLLVLHKSSLQMMH